MLIQSDSMSAVSGWAFALKRFAGPITRSREPDGFVRKRNGVFQVMIPSPNWLLIHPAHSSGAASMRKSMLPGSVVPRQMAEKPTGFLIHQPVWLTIVSGKHRYA